jgi:adenylate kinase family enzyme
MRDNRDTPLAATIQDKLDNQGFLTSEELNPFICQAIKDGMSREPQTSGILVDGFPRSTEQLDSWSVWPFPDELPLAGEQKANAKPDMIISLRITKQNAKTRYSARARDTNDSDEKFEKRFAEYEAETLPVEETYRKRRMLIDVGITLGEHKNY